MSGTQKRLECPFTWGIKKQWACDYDEMEEPIVTFEDESLLSFISQIMITYIRAEKADYEGAFANLKSTDVLLERLIDIRALETMGVSIKVLRHVKNSTEYFIYDLTERKLEAEGLLKILESSESFQNICEAATIDGCKSIAWSIFHEDGKEKAEGFARDATLKSPNCPLWHYTLGKSLRLSRREVYGSNPSIEEQNAIIKSYELSMTPFYKIFLAQMYREKRDFLKAQEIYLDIFRTKPKSSGLLVRLASGFLTVFDEFYRAKQCLDAVSESEQNSMYYDVLGKLYTKQKKYKDAVVCYEKAAMKGNNFKADFQLVLSLQRLEKDFDFIEHLEKMLPKYDKNIKYKQQLLLHIAMEYYFKKINIAKTLSYLLRSIELRPESQQLATFFNVTVDWRTYNIYDFLSKLLEYNEWYLSKLSNTECNDVLVKLEDYCKTYQKARV